MRYFAVTKDTEKMVEQDSTVPDPRKTELEPSRLEEIIGWIFPAQIAAAGYVIGTELMQWYLIGFVLTIAIAASLPARALGEEAQRPGVPTLLIVQIGKFILDFQTRFFTPRPLVQPQRQKFIDDDEEEYWVSRGIPLDDFCKTVDNEFSIIRDDGETIAGGTWLTPEAVNKEYEKILKAESGTESRSMEYLGRLRERLEMWKTRIYWGLGLGFLIYLFQHPLIWAAQVLLSFIGW